MQVEEEYNRNKSGVITGHIDRTKLYSEFAPLIKKLIYQYGTCPQLREELSGEIYCRFSSLLDAYDPSRGIPLKPYLVRQLTASTYTYVRSFRRSSDREVSVEMEMENIHQDERIDPTREWIHRLHMESARKHIATALNRLSSRQKKVVVWRYVDNYSFDEIANSLEIETSTARSLLRHGLNTIRRNLNSMQFEME